MYNQLRTRCRWSLIFLTIYFSPIFSLAQKQDVKSRIHTPAEILKVMEQSQITYEINIDDSLAPAVVDSPIVLSNQLWLKKDEHGYTLVHFDLSDAAAETLKSAEEAFQKKDFDSALRLYLAVQKLEPAYHHIWTLIGDVFYSQGQYEKAKEHFEKVVANNFADYNAHWFLGDAEWQLGRKKEAIREITIAHLLNVNHQALKKVLLNYRDQFKRPWKDWQFAPRFSLSLDDKKVVVKFATDWMGYALVKAVWKYEPGYAESMSGPEYETLVVNMLEEKEALVSLLAHNEKLKLINKIIEDGYVNEFIYYELLAKRAPMAIVLLPQEDFMRLAEYIEKYH